MPRVLLPCLLAAVLLAGGCGGGADDAPEAASPSTTPTATTSPSEAPSATPSESPTASSSASAEADKEPGARGDRRGKGIGQKMDPSSLPAPRAGAAAAVHLLAAEDLPSAGDGLDWTTSDTGPEGSRRVGLCQRASLFDIGALRAVLRVHTGPDGSGLRARQVVARYADRKSAWRAEEVLRSWREDCEDSVDDAEVGPLRTVAVEPGHGARYRAGTDDRDSSHGIVRHGRWISLVDISAPDADYPSSWTSEALRRIAATW